MKLDKLITVEQFSELIINHVKHGRLQETDFTPVVKLFTANASATWLFTEYDPIDELFFGLCDLGQGFPELGYVSRAELESLPAILLLERDLHVAFDRPLSEYQEAARASGSVMV